MTKQAWIKEGSTWRQVDPTGAYIKEGSTWRQASEIWIKEGSTWRQVFQKSSPINVWAYPRWTYSYLTASPYDDINTGTWINNDDLAQHYWNSYLGGNYIAGVMHFNLSDFGALGGRNVVKSATIRLTANTDYVADGVQPRIYQNTNVPTTKPATFNTGSGLSVIYNDGARLGVGVTNQFAIHNVFVQTLVDGDTTWGLVVRNNTADSETARRQFRGTWAGLSASTATRPRLDFTVDYV
jgi:hypothetical protein